MKLIIIIFFILHCSIAFSQNNCRCCSRDHQNFNFWVGEWIVYDTAGNILGENTIESLENGCLITENWKSGSGSSRRSFNFYNTADSTWNQVWVDSNGSNLFLKGNYEGERMVLTSDLTTSPSGKKYFNRISWTLNSDSTVTQHWQILDANKNILPKSAFKGIYKRK